MKMIQNQMQNKTKTQNKRKPVQNTDEQVSKRPKVVIKDVADEKQKELHKKFTPGTFLGDAINIDHILRWNTFFRRNLHRLAIDYLGINLHPYQAFILYIMGICQLVVIIACRAAAKSFIIALYACCRCIVYPHSKIVLSSATKGQSKLIVSEKIQNELMNMSPMLRKEILKIKDNQNEVIVYFRSGSTITVVPASENGRGYRSNCVIREEFRQIDKNIDDSILSPFQTIRNAPYMIDPYYAQIKVLQEEPVDVYISSSWIDNGHWMWNIVDTAYASMMKEDGGFLFAFDESITLKHNIRTMRQMQRERKKQDPLTWRLEFLNERVKEDEHAFFTYMMLHQNQHVKKPFYPRTIEDFRLNKKNPYDIPKQQDEIRIVACDMAFIENKNNDNSIFSCMRLLPESTTYTRADSSELEVSMGYRRIIPYLESVQGGDVVKQAIRIRELFEDFHADYIVLDMRNAGIAIYDLLAKTLFDEDRNCEYSPLSCMNDDNIANRIRANGANPCIFVINASQKLNSDIAMSFRRGLIDKRIELLVNFEQAQETILPNIKEYVVSPDAYTQIFYESPFLETQALISETTGLVYEKNLQTGAIIIKEKGSNRKDRYTSCSYGNYFADLLEQDFLSGSGEYEYETFIN